MRIYHQLFWQLAATTLAVIGLTAALPIASANAIQSGGVGLYPTGATTITRPWFQYQVPLGGNQTDSVTVQNRSGVTINLLIYPVDAAPTGDGGFGMLPQADRPRDAGSWIHLAASKLRLNPGDKTVIPFKFTVPRATSVGPHYAGIVIQPQQTPQRTHTNGMAVQIVARIGVRLYETVPGSAHPRITLSQLHYLAIANRIGFGFLMYNRGNTIVIPAGQMEVTNLLGRTVATLGLNAGRELSPGQRLAVRIPTDLSAGGIPQPYVARLQLRDATAPGLPPTTYTIRFWAGSTHLAEAIAAGSLVLLGGLVVVRRRLRKIGARGPSTSPSRR